jgi:hypothetical protein
LPDAPRIGAGSADMKKTAPSGISATRCIPVPSPAGYCAMA